ncbi:7201_t:CDS:1, partial [Ambispora gerdemannii]
MLIYSEPASPSSIYSDEEIITRTMGDIKDYDTEKLINYLNRNNLKLKNSHFAILRKQEIT